MLPRKICIRYPTLTFFSIQFPKAVNTSSGCTVGPTWAHTCLPSWAMLFNFKITYSLASYFILQQTHTLCIHSFREVRF